MSPFLVLRTDKLYDDAGESTVNFLSDTGAEISVICHTIIPNSVKITHDATFTIGANGSPLDVV